MATDELKARLDALMLDPALLAALLEDDDDEAARPTITLGAHATHMMHRMEGKRGDKKRRIITFDTEDNSKGEVDIVDFYDGERHWTFWKEQGKDFLEQAVKCLYRIASAEGTLVVAHNLEYDINNLFRWCNWAPIADMSYSSRLISAHLTGMEKTDFWDSFNLCPTSLSNMAKMLGREKGDFAEARKDLAANIGYCQSDTEILWEFMESFQALSMDTIGCAIRPTIGATAMRAWRKRFMESDYQAFSAPIAMEAFYGGRTEAFYIGSVGHTKLADVNSMYPTQMLKEYPDCSKLEKSTLKTHRFGVGHFKIRVPHTLKIPPLPYRVGGRLLFPTGDLEGAWVYEEIRYAVEQCGCTILSEADGIGTNYGCKPFAGYVDFFYGKRNEAKEAGNEFAITYYKLLLNNLFGKMSQHLPRTIVCREEPKARGKGAKMVAKRLLGPFEVWEEQMTEPAPTTNFLWGSYVTAYARTHLHGIFTDVDAAGHNVLYCDTDSVMFEVKKGAPIPYVVSKLLGDMGEEEFHRGQFLTAKGYWLEGIGTKGKDKGQLITKLACKGVPKAYGLEFLKSGFAKFERPVKMREGFVQGIVANYWRDVEKTAKTEYLKRCVAADGSTRAWRSGELAAVLKKMQRIGDKKEGEKNM
jgi:hypothetical protein